MMYLIKMFVNYLMLELYSPLKKRKKFKIYAFFLYIKFIRILRICLKLFKNSVIIKQFANASADKRIFSTGFNIGSD